MAKTRKASSKRKGDGDIAEKAPASKKAKTNAGAEANPKKKATKKTAKTDEGASPSDSILAKMMELHMKRNSSSISFAGIMKARKMNDHNTAWRNAWRELIDEGYIWAETNGSVFTSDFKLTDKGLEHSMTPEYKELKKLMEKPVKDTKEHQERIKQVHCAGWNNRGVEIFDLLLKHGSCKRKEIAALIGISDRGANFHYSLQCLLQHQFVEKHPNHKGNIRLSDKAFLSRDDRPEPVEIDQELLAAGMEKVYGREMSKAQQEKEEKAATKMSAKAEKDAEKAAKKAEKDAEKAAKKAEKDAEKEEKKQAKKAKAKAKMESTKGKTTNAEGESSDEAPKKKSKKGKSKKSSQGPKSKKDDSEDRTEVAEKEAKKEREDEAEAPSETSGEDTQETQNNSESVESPEDESLEKEADLSPKKSKKPTKERHPGLQEEKEEI